MRWVSSRFLIAPPRFSAASSSSPASFRGMVFSPRLRAASISQRMARARRRDWRTSTGTWEVAPPTRRDFTSTDGEMLPSAFSTTSSGFGFFSPITSMAPYTIFSATDFLPLYITMLMKRAMVSLPCFGSGSTERCGVFPLRDIVLVPFQYLFEGRKGTGSALRTLGAVLGAGLLALGHAGGVERAAHGVVAHAGEVLDAAAADQHHRVLLQVVAFAAEVGDDLVAVGQAHLGDLAQGRVR